MNTEKVYVLKKDLPDAKAGREFVHNKTYNRYYLEGNVLGSYWDAEWVENNPEWFTPKQPVEDKRIEVTGLWHAKTVNYPFQKHNDVIFKFATNASIPTERYEAVKKAIEIAINPPTLERQESKASKEQDWEVVAYSYKNYIYKKNGLGEFATGIDAPLHLLLLHPEDMKTIHSVRRKSDGEVFTVWEKVIYNTPTYKGSATINRFQVENNKMWAMGKNLAIATIDLLEKPAQPKEEPKPLFTTHDGKEVYEGDEVWWVYIPDYSINHTYKWGSKTHGIFDCNVYFSSKSLAEDYVSKNKVVLVTEDGVGLKDDESYWQVHEDFSLAKYQISADWVNYSDNSRTFSTKEKADEWVMYNKPMLSVNDIFSYGGGSDIRGEYAKVYTSELIQLAKARI